MDVLPSLLLYVVIVILICLIAIRFQIRIWSAIIMSLMLGQIILNIICPPSEIDNGNGDPSSSVAAFYLLIQFGTPIVCVFFLLNKCWNDRWTDVTR